MELFPHCSSEGQGRFGVAVRELRYMRHAEAIKLGGELLTVSSSAASQDSMCGDAKNKNEQLLLTR